MSNSSQLWKTIFRWISVFPASVLGMILAAWLWRLFYNIITAGFIDTFPWLNILVIEILSNFLAGAAFIYVGFKIAPNYQRTIAVVLCGLLLLLSGSSLFIVNFMTKDYFSNISIVCGNIGSILCCVSIFKGEMDEKNY